MPDEEQAYICLEHCEVWEEWVDQCRRHLQVSHIPDNHMQLQHHHDQLFAGKASLRTRQCGFLALPTTESWSLDLPTLNLAAQLGTRLASIFRIVGREVRSNIIYEIDKGHPCH